MLDKCAKSDIINSGMAINLTADQVALINSTVSKGHRVEIIPVKDGLRVVKIERHNIQPEPKNRAKNKGKG